VAVTLVRGLTAAADDAQVVVHEDFEGYADTAAMQIVWGTNGLGRIDAVPHELGKAAYHPGGKANVLRGFEVQATSKQDVVLTADIYDFGTNANKRISVGLRNSAKAILELGCFNTGGNYFMRGEGFAGSPGWRCFDAEQASMHGWHRFQAIISISNLVVTLDLGAKGKVDKRLEFAGPTDGVVFTELRFGGPSDVLSAGGGALFDNIRLELVPAGSITNRMAAGGGAGGSRAAGDKAMLRPASGDKALTAVSTQPASDASAPKGSSTGPEATVSGGAIWWIVAGVGAIILLLAALLFVISRRFGKSARALVTTGGSAVTVTEAPTGGDANWQRRALAAEALAGKQSQILREQIMPGLTEFAKQGLVQGLYSQRNDLLAMQEQARQDVAALEARLTELQAPLQERIRTYEHRIAELEKQLETRSEEMRELIRATLLLVQQKLAEERAKERSQFGRM